MLTIELVPKSAWFSNLRSELSKQKWDELRKQCYGNADYRCEVCGGKGNKWPVECHEVWRYDDNKKIQKLIGLVSLCPKCHLVKHIGFAGIQGRYKEARDHLAKVNKWNVEQANKYVREQIDIWNERSEHEWEIDISWVK